jgi:glutamate-1-semialdehyde 2,1-aminomutase
MSRNDDLFARAQRTIPGGVNSPVRAFRSVGGTPRFFARGEGAYLWDADGKRYIDYVGSWGPAILGHARPEVVRAVQEAARSGLSFGAPTEAEIEMAETLGTLLPSIELVRLVSSGTEATMSALRLARGYTGRSKIVKFEGCYHGHSDALLVKAGSGVATLGIPGSAGVPEEVVEFTLALPYNNRNAVEAAFARFKGRIACVIVEPVVGNMGCVPPEPGYLKTLREITAREGALLIFDEVMTGFRVAFGGASELYNIQPDLTTLGKIIGGGLPVGAYGGPASIMDLVAPVGPVYQAGTLSGNPLAMAAGITTLCQLKANRERFYRQLDRMTGRLVAGVMAAAKAAGVSMTANRIGSMFTFFFTGRQVTDWESALTCNTAKFGRFHGALLDAGVWLPPSQFEAAFLSAAHTQADIDTTIAAAREALAVV